MVAQIQASEKLVLMLVILNVLGYAFVYSTLWFNYFRKSILSINLQIR